MISILPQRNDSGMLSVAAGRIILREIFPNYPELEPCKPCPAWALCKKP